MLPEVRSQSIKFAQIKFNYASKDRLACVEKILAQPAFSTVNRGQNAFTTRSSRARSPSTMKFSFYTDDVTKLSCGLLGILVFEEQVGEGTIFKAIDGKLEGLLGRLVADEQFKGKKGQTLSLHTPRARRSAAAASRRWRRAQGPAAGRSARIRRAHRQSGRRRAGDGGRRRAAVSRGWRQRDDRRARRAVPRRGRASSASYKFDKYLTGDKKKPSPVEEVKIVATPDNVDGARLEALKRGAQRGEQVAAGVALARDLINEPAGDMTPTQDGRRARRRSPSSTASRSRCSARRSARSSAWACTSPSPRAATRSRASSTSPTSPRARRAEEEDRAHRQGRHVRLGRPVAQAVERDGGHEDRHVRRRRGDRARSARSPTLGSPYEVHALAACTENMPSGNVVQARRRAASRWTARRSRSTTPTPRAA